MQLDNHFAGSPIIPERIYLLYAIGILLIFLISFFWNKKHFIGLFLRSLFLYNFILFAFIFTVSSYLFIPETKATKVKYVKVGNSKGTVEIYFNRPVKRGELTKEINPYTGGVWIFEDPIYDTHLYRKLVFYPYTHLTPGKDYSVQLSGIKNFLNSSSNLYTYNFHTPDTFDILGDSTTPYKFSVLGSFPEDGWDGINVDSTIRVRFSHPVEKTSAEGNFLLTPFVAGTFSWDGETMIYTPENNLEYEREYTITIEEGVKILNGSFRTQRYNASFKTQAEVTKLSAPSYLQKYTLSCEIAALRMALAYRGVGVSEDELLNKVGFDPNGKKGNIWGNPYVGFVGNIRGKQMVNGYGVYWEPVARAANNYRYSRSFENWDVANLTESIQKSTPVIVWISIKGLAPTIWTTPAGDQIKAVPDEHAVLVVGYTGSPNKPTQIIVNDPLIGEAYWQLESFEKKWASLGNSGVVVY